MGVMGLHGLQRTFDAAGGLTAAEHTAMQSLVPASQGKDITPGHGAFQKLTSAMVNGNGPPHVVRTFEDVVALVRGPNPPKTVGQLLEATRQMAARHLASMPDAPRNQTARNHLITGTALIALAAHAVKADRAVTPEMRVREQFPLFLHDGRAGDFAYDKTCHALSHAMFSFVALYDRKYGQGDVAGLLYGAKDAVVDPEVVQRIEQAYQESGGKVGPLLRSVRAAPDESAPLFAQTPTDLSAEEQKAFDGAVAVGHMHEASTTESFQLADVGLATGGANAKDTHDALRGLEDPGVGRDLTANRLGALLGVMAMREPTEFMTLPWDDGVGGPSAPYAESHPVLLDKELRVPDVATSQARAKAVMNALKAKDTTPATLMQLVVERSGIAQERPGQVLALGKPVRTQGKTTRDGMVIEQDYEHGKMRLTMDTNVDSRGYAEATLEMFVGGSRKIRKELPSTVLPSRRHLAGRP